MTPAILAAYFALSSWGSPCINYQPIGTETHWEAPYNYTTYAASCGMELRFILVTSDVSFHRDWITYFTESEWLRNMPDIENMMP